MERLRRRCDGHPLKPEKIRRGLRPCLLTHVVAYDGAGLLRY
jgi:hypothetical protein